MKNGKTLPRSRTNKAFDRAQRVLVGGVNSPVRAFRAVGGTPLFISRAAGPHLFDVDGREYIDLVCSWGAIIVGHAHPQIVEAVSRAARDGLSFGACCEREAELAEFITSAISSVEILRFVSSGTEATMSAIRLARAATGRDCTVKFVGGYHGHVDSLLVAAGSGAAAFGVPDSAGVPASFAATTLVASYNDLDAVEALLRDHGSQVAAILVEPIAGNMGFVPPAEGFLAGLRRLCDRHGCLLIFDEVMTGFRVAWGGYQSLCGVRPDLTCLGKVIGGGMPLAAYGGSRKLMSMVSPLGPAYQAGTLSGSPIALAAGIATLRICQAPGFYDSLAAKTSRLVQGLRGDTGHAEACGGLWGFSFHRGPVCNFDDARACDHPRYARFFHAMLQRGVFLPPSGYEAMFLTSAHDDAIVARVLEAAHEALRSSTA